MELLQKTTIDLQHYAGIHNKRYTKQPQGNDMATITMDLKRKGHAELYTTKALLEAMSNGHSAILSNFEVDSNNSIRFISASAFAIDIDDDNEVTEPLKVLNNLKDICPGLFYTFSHNKKGNRYRLLFQLDKSITDEDDLKLLIEYMNYYLQKKDLPVDSLAPVSTIPIRGGVQGYEVNSLNVTLNTDQWLSKAKEHFAERLKNMREQQKKKAEQMKNNLNNPVTYDELKEMIEAIGHLPTGESDETTEKWLQIVYALKHQVQMELLEEDEGYELFHIVSGGESNQSYWNSIKPTGQVSVGTIVYHATESGYRRKHSYNQSLQVTPDVIDHEQINVKQYIPVDVAVELLQRNQKLLVDSPTNSGKTTAFIDAFKQLANEDNHYYIFTAPTTALTEQIAKEHNLPSIIGGKKNLKHNVVSHALKGQKVFVSVYDKTTELVSYLKDITDDEPKITIVIDEVHKFAEAYNYRFKTIDNIEAISKETVSLIGLSGTMEDVLKTRFDKLIQIDTGDKKSPCTDFRVFTYDVEINGAPVSEYADVMLIPVIKSLVEKTQLLLFINNKERIERIGRLLKKEGINYMTISSDTKQAATYRKIVEESAIADDVQVVIATTVLADGVSINNGVKWSCLVVADTESPLFNPSTIKQISNRFRNQYTYFGIYMRTPNPDYSETRRFNMESDYKYRENVVSDYVDYLNNEYPDELLQNFIPSNVEKSNGIFYKSTEDEAIIEYNPLFVRHQCVRRKEKYYRAYRNAFTKEVGRLLGHQLTGVFNVNDEVRQNGSDLSGLLADVVAEKEEKKLEADELRANFTTYFDESIYLAMVYRDEHGTLEYFKIHVHPDQYSATLKNSRITDYETCKMLGEKVTRRADINRYANDIQALTDIASFNYVKKVTLTERVFNALMKMEGKRYLSSDFKLITEEDLPKKLKVSKGDVKEGLKLFHKFSTKESGEAYTTIRPLSMRLLTSKVKYDVETEVIKESILKQISTKSKQQQKVLHQAVKLMYDIEPSKNNIIEPAKTGTFQLDLS